jgi:uncharacterized membrane protein YidH (DUF202 family)
MRQPKRWLYGEGSEPDYRFSLANERTLLAWVRTALAWSEAASLSTRSKSAFHPRPRQ